MAMFVAFDSNIWIKTNLLRTGLGPALLYGVGKSGAKLLLPPPFVEVQQLVFEGTYDAFQWDRVMRRQHVFDASLFGSLLPAEAWQRVPSDRLKDLLNSAPSFSPKPEK